ncbi:MAG: immunoglobulin domain-containing protein [Verrucomicrobia bacterium]|nr:immunoglobulin domain-containing protein [Verrucomicrobiota bacterium]MCH8511843.1 immunoglobulin domain-containing protein [Kiritimatiellia bacterium]
MTKPLEAISKMNFQEARPKSVRISSLFTFMLFSAFLVLACWPGSVSADKPVVQVDVRNRRILVNPLDHEQMPRDVRAQSWDQDNVMFPSLIRVPEWAPNRLGNYYLYCGGHNANSHMYLFYSDHIEGPYTLHVMDYTDPEGNTRKISTFPIEKGVMQGHHTAPDVHIEDDGEGNRRFMMIYHGDSPHGRFNNETEYQYYHRGSVAFSDDGIHWQGVDYHTGHGYARWFTAEGKKFQLTRLGWVPKEEEPYMWYGDGGGGGGAWFLPHQPNYQFKIPTLRREIRHPGLYSQGGKELYAIYTRFDGRPERVKMMYISDITADKAEGLTSSSTFEEIYAPYGISDEIEVIRPYYDWEGADGDPTDNNSVNQLRTPQIFADEINDKFYLLYAYRGEGGIAMAEINIFLNGMELLPVSGYVEPRVLPGDFTEIIHPSMEAGVHPGEVVSLVGRGNNLTWSYRADDGEAQRIGTGETATLTAPMAITLTIILEGDGGTEERVFALGGSDPVAAPEITRQPIGQTVYAGTVVTFSVIATGNPPPQVQWRKDGEDLDGETGASLVVSNVNEDSMGDYDVRVSNAVGSVVSEIATLTVGPPPAGVDAISINFHGQYPFPADQNAGLLPRPNWNQVQQDATDLVDNEGNVTAMTYSTSLRYQYNRATASGESADHRMMSAHQGDGPTGTITFENIPFDNYDVYIYWGGHYRDELTPDFMSVKLGDQTFWLRRDNITWNGTYTRSTATTKADAEDSNYILFEDQNASSLVLTITADTANNQNRAGPSGIQFIRRDDD